MNITFQGNNYNRRQNGDMLGTNLPRTPYDTKTKRQINNGHSQRPQTRPQQQDSWQPQRNNNHVKPKSTGKNIATHITAFTAGILSALAIFNQQANIPATVNVPFDSEQDTLSAMSEIYNVDEEIIERYNGIYDVEDLEKLEQIKVPSAYSYINDEIAELQDKLYENNLKSEKREEYEERIQALQNKLEKQEQYAKTYTNGKMVYFLVQKDINVETFKEIFDIKNKAIRENNELDFSWGTYDNGMGGYMDYTTETLQKGQIIKVPMNKINTGDKINLENFAE